MSDMKDNDDRPFELRFYLTRQFADAVRVGRRDEEPELAPLWSVLERHGARIDHSQFDEFQAYVDAHDRITDWETTYPDPDQRRFNQQLHGFTKKTLADPEKAEYLSREFTVSAQGGKNFKGSEADALMADLDASGVLGGGPRAEGVCRKVFFPARHPGTTG